MCETLHNRSFLYFLVHSTARLAVIDYEYAGFNFVGFDIANHFCEYGGFASSAAELVAHYPSERAARHFFSAYLCALGERIPTRERPAGGPVEKGEAANETFQDEVSISFFKELYDIVTTYALASHLTWCVFTIHLQQLLLILENLPSPSFFTLASRGLWAVVQARHSPINFDFANYANVRFEAFTRQRDVLTCKPA